MTLTCIRQCCLELLELRQCWGCGSRRVGDLTGLDGAELVDGKLRYDPKRIRVLVVEDICSADCFGLPGVPGRSASRVTNVLREHT